MNMAVNIAGVEWKNPVTTASGTFGSGEEFSEFVDLNQPGRSDDQGGSECAMAGKSNTASGRSVRWHDECHRSAESGHRSVL